MLRLLPDLAPLINLSCTLALVHHVHRLPHAAPHATVVKRTQLHQPHRSRKLARLAYTLSHTSAHTNTARDSRLSHDPGSARLGHDSHSPPDTQRVNTPADTLDTLPATSPDTSYTPTDTPTSATPVFLLGADTQGGDHDSTITSDPTSQGTITTPKKVYRPPLAAEYQPPELGEDLLDNTAWTFRSHGKSLTHATTSLPPRDDMIHFNNDDEHDAAEFTRNFRPGNCPQHPLYSLRIV